MAARPTHNFNSFSTPNIPTTSSVDLVRPQDTPTSAASSNNTFLMPASPAKQRKGSSDGYRPKIITTVGARPACLVNASVTYVGNDQIYAFGGFDQYTDEGERACLTFLRRISPLTAV